jgi:LPS-assembly protein
VLRSAAAPAALALLVLGPPARGETSLFAGPPGEEVEVEADRITYAWEAQVIRLEGHVVARRGGGIVRAASGSLDRAHGVLKLEGGVLGVQGRQVFLADAAIVDLNARSAELTKAVLYLKDRPANPDAPRSGVNALTLHGSRVRQLAGGRYLAEKVTLTPCDCAGNPDYELLADSAEIDGDRAHLRGVDLRFAFGGKIPLFPLSLPLTSRQSGVLAPQPGFGGPTGFTWAQPVFFTLGPSYDLTLTPGWHTGGGSHGAAPGLRSIKGPMLGTEFRYAPVPGTAGSLSVDLFDDLDQHDSPGGRGYGGVRGIGHLAHRTESAAGVFAAQGVAASDVMAVRDQTAQSIETTFDLFTTDVGFWRASGPLTLGADATLMQDMRIDPASIDRTLFRGGRGTTFQRLPALFMQIAPVSLGPTTFSLEASAVQFTRFGEPDAREVTQGFGQTDRASSLPAPDMAPYTDGSRAPAFRLDLAPRLALDAPRTLPVELRVEAGGRVDGWIVEGASDRNRARAYALLSARAAVPLERRYGSALHRIEPALEVRALSRSLQAGGPPFGDLTDHGGTGFLSRPDDSQQGLAAASNDGISGVPAARRAYDEIDFAAPVSGAVEATASLSQSLWTKPGGAPGRILRFDLLQDALLWVGGGRARLGEGSAVAAVQLGPGGVQGSVRYDWSQRQLSAFGAAAGVRDARGDEIHASFGVLRGASSERLRAGIDELFSAARFANTSSTLTGSARAGASGPLPFGMRLAYEVGYTPGAVPVDFANWLHMATIAVETPCRCAGLQFVVSLPFNDARLLRSPSYSLRIDLKSLGSFTTF